VPTRPQVVGAYLNQCGRAPTLKHCIQDFYNNEKWACQAYCGDLHFPRRTLEDCVASVARFRRLTHQEPALAASRFRFFLERWCGVQTRARS
jgi:hypothetical protein